MSSRMIALVLVATFLIPYEISAATPAEMALKQQLERLQAQYAAAEKQLAAMQAQLVKAKGNDGADATTIANLRQQVAQLQSELKTAKGNDATDSKTIKTAQGQLDSLRKAKFVHSIVYKSKTDTDSKEIQSLADDANLFFATVKPVRAVWAGKTPSDSSDYQVVIVLLFDDANGLQTFLKDPQWKKFTDKHAKLWEEPKYFDGTIGK